MAFVNWSDLLSSSCMCYQSLYKGLVNIYLLLLAMVCRHRSDQIIVTLCAYAQQGYVFSHIGLCICMSTKQVV